MTVSFKLVAGDTLSYLVSPPTGDGVTYTPAGGWTLKYRLIPRSASGSVIELTATTSGTSYQIAAPAADTANYVAGYYGAAAWVEKGTEKYTVEPVWEQLQILANPRTAVAGTDTRSDAQKALDDARTALHNAQAAAANAGTSQQVQEYRIGDRWMKYADAGAAVTSLIAMVQMMEREVARERRADAIRRGMADPRKVYLRMGSSG